MLTFRELEKLPLRKVVSILARSVFEQQIKVGRERLPKELQHFSLAVELNGEIMNGGISQYFTNSAGEDYKQALEALSIIGAEVQKRIVLKWLSYLPANVRPGRRNEVGLYVFSKPELMKKLDCFDKEYFDSADSFYGAMVEYVKKHAKVFQIS